MQLYATPSSVFFGGYAFDATKFSVVRRIAESLKTHIILKLESYHISPIQYNCARPEDTVDRKIPGSQQ
jgi:hypothetical protein